MAAMEWLPRGADASSSLAAGGGGRLAASMRTAARRELLLLTVEEHSATCHLFDVGSATDAMGVDHVVVRCNDGQDCIDLFGTQLGICCFPLC